MWIFLAVSFEIRIVSGIARIVAERIVVRISERWFIERFVIWESEKAAPVRDFWKRISVRKDVDMTIVLIEPRRIRNCSRVAFLVTSEAMTAAWLLPSPGNKEQIGEIRIVAMVGLISSDFGRESFSIDCFGRTVFCFMEWIRVEVAKRPVRSGSSGLATPEFSEARPKNPASRNMMVAFIFDSRSFRIRRIAIQIRRIPIILWSSG